jgi:hypothetical protein
MRRRPAHKVPEHAAPRPAESLCPIPPGQYSVLDVEGVTEGLVEPDPGFEVELADVFWVEKRGGNGYQVVAADDAGIGNALGGPDSNLRADTADRSGDRRAGDGGEHLDGGVTGEDADGPPPGWRSQVGPNDVTALYHSGAVSEASREVAETIAGSWGNRR